MKIGDNAERVVCAADEKKSLKLDLRQPTP
jgi:hypothetical protein